MENTPPPSATTRQKSPVLIGLKFDTVKEQKRDSIATSNRATGPVLTDGKSYSNWKKEIAIWQLAITLSE